MKKTIFTLAIAGLVLAACSKENTNGLPENDGPVFTIETGEALQPSQELTKTSFSTDMKTVVWDNTDKLSVITGNNGNFTLNMEFTKGAGANEFNGTFVPETGTNNYYALYPYDGDLNTIAPEKADVPGSRKVLFDKNGKVYSITIDPGTQNGLDNMDHIHVPLWGKGSALDDARPTVNMSHLAAIFKVTVDNPGTEAINVTSVKISNDGTEKMTGKYRINADAKGYPLLANTGANNYAELKVNGGTIAAGSHGDFYIMTSRVRLNQPSEGDYKHPENLTFEVKTDKDFVTVNVPNTEDKQYVFNTGAIHKARIDYTGAQMLETGLELPATVDFKEVTAKTDYMIYPEGTVASNVKFLKEQLRITKKSEVIFHTKGTPSQITVNANEYNTKGTLKAKLEIYGSANNIDYELLKSTELAGQAETATEFVLETEILDGMKYFKFKNITPDENLNNRCVAINRLIFAK